MNNWEIIVDKCNSWLMEGHRVALVTVIEASLSSPRPVGSLMVVREDGEFCGSSSAGCVEVRAIEVALDVIESSHSEVLIFDPSPECDVFETGYTCGQRVRLLVEPVFAQLEFLPGSVAVRSIAPSPSARVEEARAEALAAKRSRTEDIDGVEHYFQYFPVRSKLVIVGAVHIAISLAKFAYEVGMAVTIIDPRATFLESERFEKAPCETLLGWPDRFISALELSPNDALVTLTHDEKIDDVALGEALKSNVGYVGALGSVKTHESRLQRLSEAGFSLQDLARIHGPVGLKIGARSPEEIAVSILSQIISHMSAMGS